MRAVKRPIRATSTATRRNGLASTINYGQRDGSAFTADARTDDARRFRTAVRHSRRVRMLRIGIPAGIAVVIAGFALSAWVSQLKILIRLPGELPGLVIQGTKITMQAPRISGYTADGRPYQLNARAAAQDLTDSSKVELQDLRAKIEMQDKAVMDMSASLGVYQTKTEMLVLRDNILLTSSTGYEARLSEAVIDIRKGNIVSDKPVAVKMLNGTLNANRLDVFDAGELLRFDGGVTMTVNLDKSAVPDTRTDVR